MVYAYGIDLGTTYSCIARANEKGEVEIIKNSEGKDITPSVVEFESAEKVAVGETAKESAIINPGNVIQYIKRDMGKEGQQRTYHGTTFTPEEISAFILKKMINDAEAVVREKITDVVITVPAYFGFDERQATINAGKIAGLNVLSIVNEPSAAAIAYSKKAENKGDKIVLVYDLGGGTFDITVAEIIGDHVEVICTNGNHNLGGKDWDTELADYVITEFCAKTNLTQDDVLSDTEFYNDLMLKVEEAKKILSTKNTTKITLRLGTAKEQIDVTREKFDELTRGHLLDTINLTKSVIETATTKRSSKGAPCNKFDEIIFVGGSTRMTQVSETIIKEFGKEPVIFEPDLAVAKGAALLAQYIVSDPNFNRDTNRVTQTQAGGKTIGGSSKFGEVTSKSYGVQTVDYKNPIGKLSNVTMKNTKIPCNDKRVFGTANDNQDNVEVIVYENDSEKKDCELSFGKEISRALLQLPPRLPEGSPIEVTFSIDESGMLTVTAIEQSKGVKCEIKTEIKGLGAREVMELQQKTSTIKVGDS
ncbi:MAG: Hsp70 family protein [Nitrososphaerota archaeon]|jgi:molecular chaperone DnaK (HSP70)|nr:Hsp70 family protein [Nitrososphaerota archaeon]